MTKAAIVILSYNALPVSQKCLSLLRQHTDPAVYKLHWIDNGSVDGTKEYLIKSLAEMDNLSFHLNDKNLGVIGGRNQGFKWFLNETKDCDVLIFLDNDQFVKTRWLDRHMQVLSSGYDIIGVEAWKMDSNFIPIRQIKQNTETFTYVSGCAFTIRRKVAEKFPAFDERFNPSYYEDPDYIFTAYDAGFKIGWDYQTRIIHDPHQTLSKAPDKQQRFMNSWNAFRMKWKDRKPPVLMQQNLPVFDM